MSARQDRSKSLDATEKLLYSFDTEAEFLRFIAERIRESVQESVENPSKPPFHVEPMLFALEATYFIIKSHKPETPWLNVRADMCSVLVEWLKLCIREGDEQ